MLNSSETVLIKSVIQHLLWNTADQYRKLWNLKQRRSALNWSANSTRKTQKNEMAETVGPSVEASNKFEQGIEKFFW